MVGNRNTKQVGALKLTKNLDLTFAVSGFDTVRTLVKVFAHTGCGDDCRVQPRIQQFVEQQWMSCNFLRKVCTVFAEADEASKNSRILYEQGNVCTAPQYLANDPQDPPKDDIRNPPVLQLQHQSLPASRALYLGTLGAAEALCLDDCVGNLEPGKEADFIILDPRATDLSARRLTNTKAPDEVLFALTMLADERNIHATYLQGQRCFNSSGRSTA